MCKVNFPAYSHNDMYCTLQRNNNSVRFFVGHTAEDPQVCKMSKVTDFDHNYISVAERSW